MYRRIIPIVYLAVSVVCFLIAPTVAPSYANDIFQGPLALSEKEHVWLKAHPVIEIGVDGNWPPIDFINDQGVFSGISANTLKMIELRLGITFKPVSGASFKDMLGQVMDGTLKVGATIAWRKDRAEKLWFTEPFFKVKYVIITRNSEYTISSLQDLENKSIAIEDGYFLHKELSEQYPNATLVPVKNTREALRAVSRGKADAYIGNRAVADWILIEEELSNLKVAGDPGFPQNPQRFAIHIDPEFEPLVSLMNKALASISEQDKLDIAQTFLKANVSSVLKTDGIVFSPSEKRFIDNTVVMAATTTNWPPFAFVSDASGKAAGIGYDYWKEITKTAGLKTDIAHFDDFSKQIQSLKDKKVDLMYSSGVTEERQKYSIFSNPYTSFPISIATSKEENFIQDVNFLKGKKIAIGRNFTAHKMMLKAFPEFTYVPVKNAKEGLQLLSQGDVFGYIDIMPTLADSINKYGFTNLKISGNTGLLFELRLMIRDDYPELLSIANKVIANFDPDLKRQILNRWINVQYDQAFDFKKYLPYAVAFSFVILLIIFSLHQSRKRVRKVNKELVRHVDESSKELRSSKGQLLKLSQALEQSPSLVFITDMEGSIEYVNAKFIRTTGYERDEIIGQNPRILKSGHSSRSLYVELWRTISSGGTWRGELMDRCKDGALFWASVSISPIRDEHKKITHFLAVHEDITLQKDAEATMMLAVEQSEIANRTKTELLANMSH
ncbi:MAG: transporter substrate-binding domain-containing protein, partial [Magnetovibrio sp.]|nr:transporter substrate-binding domain-containing protein [Magnetovibrio sp.]